ncbi:hypothetical protein [Mumia zhuanghuii]|uniref:Uncharacterized protein n=1 Tax=Mumia zhuanghuii TaxID=2585211 RepID=A0A5C4M5B5_9ACTN|nr:hypothetical protein [Mumia zhuanghuii]TNC28424.1 hypothetical protein FHE65_33935 [Mumia zhuanghuii]
MDHGADKLRWPPVHDELPHLHAAARDGVHTPRYPDQGVFRDDKCPCQRCLEAYPLGLRWLRVDTLREL